MPSRLRVALDVLFPVACEVCDAPLPLGSPLCVCASCWARMMSPAEPLCVVCGVPLGAAGECAACAARRPVFASARAAGVYVSTDAGPSPLATAVQRLKYGGRRRLARTLGTLLAERYPFGDDALLVPVPLHLGRLRARGFNQALLLARELGRRRGLPVSPNALVRTRATAAQPGLAADARRRNLADAFRAPVPEVVRGRRVVLVDDVLTTGATADACATALVAAGAARVDVYTAGRAP